MITFPDPREPACLYRIRPKLDAGTPASQGSIFLYVSDSF